MNLLSVDWDYFFPDKLGSGDKDELLYDWGHKESPFFINGLWEVRAASFIRNELLLPNTTGEDVGFWNKFKFTKHTALHFAESHSKIVSPVIIKNIDTVWSFDAHHDAGYGEIFDDPKVYCQNWAEVLQKCGVNIHVRYPQWKKWAFNEPQPNTNVNMDRMFTHYGEISDITFNRVFVCRSGAWAPSWLDYKFFDFINSFPGRKYGFGPIGVRPFVLQNVKTIVKQTE